MSSTISARDSASSSSSTSSSTSSASSTCSTSSSSSSSNVAPLTIPETRAEFLKVAPALLNDILRLFAADEFYPASVAYEKALSLTKSFLSTESTVDKGKLLSESDQPAFLALLDRLTSKDFQYIANISKELTQLKEICNRDLSADSSWKKISSRDGINTYHRAEIGQPTHTLYVEGDVEGNIFNILAMIYEVDLLPTWMPLVPTSSKLGLVGGSKFRLVAQMTVMALWPVARREVLIYGYGGSVEGNVGVYFRSVKKGESFNGIDLPEPPKNHVRADLHLGGMWLTPISSTTTRLQAAYNFDPKLSLVPYTLINFFSEQLCFLFISIMRKKVKEIQEYKEKMKKKHDKEREKKAKKEGSKNSKKEDEQTEEEEHAVVKRINDNPAVYSEIRRRILALGGHAAAALLAEEKHGIVEEKKEVSVSSKAAK